MTSFVITTATSKIDNNSTAFVSTTKNGTLTVDAQASLISMADGDGADVTDFTAVTVDGVLAGYANGQDGLESLGATKNALALTVGATGEIYGGGDGVYSMQIDAISNAGLIEGEEFAAIYEDPANAGASSVTNAATGQIIGAEYGIYAYGDKETVTETVANSGLIEGANNTGISFNNIAGAKIVNAASARIFGETGIDDDISSGAQKIQNSGLIDGYEYEGVIVVDAAKTTTITNEAAGQIAGAIGVQDKQSSGALDLVNDGLISGTALSGIDFEGDASAAASTISNAATGQITGYQQGLVVADDKGAATVSNAGLIWGQDDYGAEFTSISGLTFTNAATGIVKGGAFGIAATTVSGAVTIDNEGEIDGSNSEAVEIGAVSGAVTISNAATARIAGSFGIHDSASSGAFELTNAGFIGGGSENAVDVENDASSAAASVTNAANAQIVSAGCGVDFDEYQGAVSVTNAGLIWGQNTDGAQIQYTGAVTVTNKSTGTVKGASYGLYAGEIQGAINVSNAGLIAGTYEKGLYEEGEGGNNVLTNAATGTITASIGVYEDYSSTSMTTISNAGAIVGWSTDAIEVYSSGTFTFTNAATGTISGIEHGLLDQGGAGARTIDNSGLIQAASGDAVLEDTAGTNTIDNFAGGQIIGGGSEGFAIYDETSSGVQTIVNAGTLTGGADALYAEGTTTVDFTNSGIVNGNVELLGSNNVTITGGTVNGSIDMSDSEGKNTFTISGGVITGEVLLGGGSSNTATIGAGVAATDFSLDSNGVTSNTFVYEAATASTAKNLDEIFNWQSTGDTLDLSAFASKLSFADIVQNFTASPGSDLITLTGTKFSVDLFGVTSAIGSNQFKF